MKKILFLSMTISLFIYGCVESPDYPIEPVIEFIDVNRTVAVGQISPSVPGRNIDTLVIRFGFTDGDGDIESDTTNIFVTDMRDGTLFDFASINDIPTAGATNGISGEITFRIPELFCSINSGPRDTVTFQIQMFDDAGNPSNVIETPPIVLICD